MALWGDTDTLADTPKFEAPSFSFDGTDAAVVVVASDHIVIPEHGIATGVPVTYTAGTTAVAGLTSGTIYYAIRVDANAIQLAASAADAAAGTEITLTAVSDDTDTIQVTPADVYFVDVTEAGLAANKAKGLGTTGWNKYSTYTAGSGETRHKAEVLVAMRQTAAEAGDTGVDGTDDAVVVDSE